MSDINNKKSDAGGTNDGDGGGGGSSSPRNNNSSPTSAAGEGVCINNNSNMNTQKIFSTQLRGAGSTNAKNATIKISKPHKNDVLCGRGSGINSHPGNEIYRYLVSERKNRYNLTTNKEEKGKISREIVVIVQNLTPPGRFIQIGGTSNVKGADGSTSQAAESWWFEIDDQKAINKTSQALREGAPSIRARFSLTSQGNSEITKDAAAAAAAVTGAGGGDGGGGVRKRSSALISSSPSRSAIDQAKKQRKGGGTLSPATGSTVTVRTNIMGFEVPTSMKALDSHGVFVEQDRTTTTTSGGGGGGGGSNHPNSNISSRGTSSRNNTLQHQQQQHDSNINNINMMSGMMKEKEKIINQLNNELTSLEQYIIKKENSWKATKHYMEQQYGKLEEECEQHVKHFTKLKNIIASKNDIIKQQEFTINTLKHQSQQEMHQSQVVVDDEDNSNNNNNNDATNANTLNDNNNNNNNNNKNSNTIVDDTTTKNGDNDKLITTANTTNAHNNNNDTTTTTNQQVVVPNVSSDETKNDNDEDESTTVLESATAQIAV